MWLLPDITKDDNKQKPSIYKFDDFTKGGTDIVDQLNDCYTARSKSKWWDILTLFYMLDTSKSKNTLLYNTQIRYKERRYFIHYLQVSKKSCLSFHWATEFEWTVHKDYPKSWFHSKQGTRKGYYWSSHKELSKVRK